MNELIATCENERPCCVRVKKKRQKKKKKVDPKKVFKGMKRVPKVKIKQPRVTVEAILGRIDKK